MMSKDCFLNSKEGKKLCSSRGLSGLVRELSNKEINMVGHRFSFSDNLQKLKF